MCYINEEGKNSCTLCGRRSDFGFSEGTAAGPDGVSTAWAQGRCQYTGTRYQNKRNTVNSLLNAAQGGLGINNQYALAGILGNSGWESAGFNPEAKGPADEIGLFQWNPAAGRLDKLKTFSGSIGLNYLTVDAQVQFFVHEVKTEFPSLPTQMNAVRTLEEGVAVFEDIE